MKFFDHHKAPGKAAFEQLRDDSRIKWASRLIPDDTDPQNVTQPVAHAVIEAVRAYQERNSLKWKEIARSIGIGVTTLGSLVNGHYVPRWQDHAIDLDKWLEAELKRETTPRPTEFVMTRVAESIRTVAEVATALKGIGLIYGWAGIGKTLALQVIAADKPGSCFVSIKTSVTTPLGVLQAIATGIGLRVNCNDGQRALTLRLEQILRGTPRLIIIDEIHKLCGSCEDKALHVLRDLYDATGVPMLWSGTIDLVAYLDRGRAKGREPLSQIRSRVCIARDLSDFTGTGDGGGDGGEPLYTLEEIRRVFAKSQMRLAPDAAQYLLKLANLPDSGALRTCRNLVIIATKIHASRGDVLTGAMLQSAHQLLVSRRDFSAVQGSLNDSETKPVARVG